MSTLLDGYRLLHDGAVALSECERAGICIDVEYCENKLAWIDEQMRRADRRFRSSELGRAWESRFGGKMSLGSGPQLQAVLYADLKVKPFKQTERGEDSVDEESLRQTGVDGIDHLLRQRSLKKMRDVLGQFLQYQIDGRLYPNFNLHTVVTYRSSASNPNLQNVPARDPEQMEVCRRGIVPSPGNVLLEIDFSGCEVAVAACYHKDPTMLAYLRDPASDMHADQAYELFKLGSVLKRYGLLRPVEAKRKRKDGKPLVSGFDTLRQSSKNGFVFPQLYGDYFESCAPRIACVWCKLPRVGDWGDNDGIEFDGAPIAQHLRRYDILGLPDFTEHVRRVERVFWDERFPVYSRWKRDFYARYQRRGSIQMKTGFTCGGAMVRNAAVNYPVQGSAFHLLLRTLIWVVERIRGWRSRVVGEVHDSLLVDADPSEVSAIVEMVRRIASEELPSLWKWVIVPLRVEAKVSEPAADGSLSWAKMKVIEE